MTIFKVDYVEQFPNYVTNRGVTRVRREKFFTTREKAEAFIAEAKKNKNNNAFEMIEVTVE